MQEESGKTAKLEEEYKLAKEVYDLLDNPDKNIADMKEKIDAFAQRYRLGRSDPAWARTSLG